MTDTLEAPPTGAEIDGDAPDETTEVVEGGQDGAVDQPGDDRQFINLDEYGNYLVPLDDDGNAIPLSELRASGLRQADYTRKTQALAAERAQHERAIALHQALQANPQGTLQWLQMQLNEGQPSQAPQSPSPQRDVDDWLADDEPTTDDNGVPLSRLEAIEHKLSVAEAKERIDATFTRLEAKYGDDFDRDEVAMAAHQRGIYDPDMLDMVYHSLKFDEVYGRTQAREQTAAQKAMADQARQRAAQEAAAVTQQGPSAAANGPQPKPPSDAPEKLLTIEEAAAKALADLEAQGLI